MIWRFWYHSAHDCRCSVMGQLLPSPVDVSKPYVGIYTRTGSIIPEGAAVLARNLVSATSLSGDATVTGFDASRTLVTITYSPVIPAGEDRELHLRLDFTP